MARTEQAVGGGVSSCGSRRASGVAARPAARGGAGEGERESPASGGGFESGPVRHTRGRALARHGVAATLLGAMALVLGMALAGEAAAQELEDHGRELLQVLSTRITLGAARAYSHGNNVGSIDPGERATANLRMLMDSAPLASDLSNSTSPMAGTRTELVFVSMMVR